MWPLFEDFGDGLRDRLICSCNEDRLQKNLLAKTPPPTFKVAIAMVQAMESADKDTKDLQSTRTAAEVHAIPRNSPPPWGQETVTAVAESIHPGIADLRINHVATARNSDIMRKFTARRHSNRR